jgi:trk system potassium uptake protein TrkA
MSKRKKIAVIGIGDFGKVLVKCLHKEGHEVLAIDEEAERIEEIKDFCSDVAIMNSTDEVAMSNMGFNDFDRVILAVANDFEVLMVTADILRNTLKLDNITARYQTELQKRLLKTAIGITDLFNPEETAAMNMAEQFEHNLMRKTMIISDNFRIAEFQIPRSFIGQTLAEIKMKDTYKLLLVTIKRYKPTEKNNRVSDYKDTEPIGIPDQSIVFRENDVIVVFGAHTDIEEFFENVD